MIRSEMATRQVLRSVLFLRAGRPAATELERNNMRKWMLAAGSMLMAASSSGCVGRAISEGLGVVTGARGKVVEISTTPDLAKYKGIRIMPVTISQGLPVNEEMSLLVKENFMAFSDKHVFVPNGTPALVVKGEIIHYE